MEFFLQHLSGVLIFENCGLVHCKNAFNLPSQFSLHLLFRLVFVVKKVMQRHPITYAIIQVVFIESCRTVRADSHRLNAHIIKLFLHLIHNIF